MRAEKISCTRHITLNWIEFVGKVHSGCDQFKMPSVTDRCVISKI